MEYDISGAADFHVALVNYEGARILKISDIIKWKIHNDAIAGKHVIDAYFYAKARDWQYEREYRALKPTAGLYNLNLKVTAIYCGYKCLDELTLVKLLAGRDDIALYEIDVRNDGFELERCEVNKDEINATSQTAKVRHEFQDLILLAIGLILSLTLFGNYLVSLLTTPWRHSHTLLGCGSQAGPEILRSERRQNAMRRRSSVCGKLGFGPGLNGCIGPGVCPKVSNRASRRVSASSAFTGNVS